MWACLVILFLNGITAEQFSGNELTQLGFFAVHLKDLTGLSLETGHSLEAFWFYWQACQVLQWHDLLFQMYITYSTVQFLVKTLPLKFLQQHLNLYVQMEQKLLQDASLPSSFENFLVTTGNNERMSR